MEGKGGSVHECHHHTEGMGQFSTEGLQTLPQWGYTQQPNAEDVLPPMVASPCATFLTFMSVLLFFCMFATVASLA